MKKQFNTDTRTDMKNPQSGKPKPAKPHRTRSGKKQAAAVETSESIAEQTRRYLESGKKIQRIDSGVSGQPTLAAKRPSGAEATPRA